MVSNIYDSGTITTFSNGEQLLVRELATLPLDAAVDISIVVEDDLLPLKAFDLYGDWKKWYLIADFNNIINPFEDLEVGQKLIIPELL